jgi:hypothetical protein
MKCYSVDNNRIICKPGRTGTMHDVKGNDNNENNNVIQINLHYNDILGILLIFFHLQPQVRNENCGGGGRKS